MVDPGEVVKEGDGENPQTEEEVVGEDVDTVEV